MINPILDKKYLDGERLFKVYWQDMGTARSTTRLQRWCLANSIVNPKTFNVPTRMGLWKVMWRWAAENQEQAKEVWTNSVDKDTSNLNKVSDWDMVILKNAKTAFQNGIRTTNYYKNMEKK